MDPLDMPKLDLAKDASKLSTSDLFHIKQFQKLNLERVKEYKKVRRNQLITAGLLGAFAASVYVYTIFAVRQEKFLDDFEIPQTTARKP